jgi:hypothetical protein
VARLTGRQRRALPSRKFAGPERSYPIEDKAHARNALARVAQHGTAGLKAQVRRKVHRKFPDLAED